MLVRDCAAVLRRMVVARKSIQDAGKGRNQTPTERVATRSIKCYKYADPGNKSSNNAEWKEQTLTRAANALPKKESTPTRT